MNISRGVLCGIETLDESMRLGGQLDFRVMAHGAIGSAPLTFQMLSIAVVRLLTHPGLPESGEEIWRLLGRD